MALTQRIQHYMETSSIKCLPKIMKSISLIQRGLWIVALVGGIVVASYQIIPMVRDYFHYKTTRQVMKRTHANVAYPDVTMCNLNPLWTDTDDGLVANLDGLASSLTYDQYINLVTSHNDDRRTPDDFRDPRRRRVTKTTSLHSLYSLSGYMANVNMETETVQKLKKLFFLECVWETETGRHTECSDEDIIPFLTPHNGLCFTVRQPSNFFMKEAALSVLLYLNNNHQTSTLFYEPSPYQSYAKGALVAVHSRGTVPKMTDSTAAGPGNEVKLSALRVEERYMEPPYGYCNRSVELPKLHNMSIDPNKMWNYSSDACEDLCTQSKIMETCRCVSSMLLTFSDVRNTYNTCDAYSNLKTGEAEQRMKCETDVITEILKSNACGFCSYPCVFEEFNVFAHQIPWPDESYKLAVYQTYYGEIREAGHFERNPDLDDVLDSLSATDHHNTSSHYYQKAWNALQKDDFIEKNFLEISVILDRGTLILEDQIALTIEGVWGSMGGILNLWVGFTFITIMEIFDFCLISAKNMCAGNKDKNKKDTNQPTSVM